MGKRNRLETASANISNIIENAASDSDGSQTTNHFPVLSVKKSDKERQVVGKKSKSNRHGKDTTPIENHKVNKKLIRSVSPSSDAAESEESNHSDIESEASSGLNTANNTSSIRLSLKDDKLNMASLEKKKKINAAGHVKDNNHRSHNYDTSPNVSSRLSLLGLLAKKELVNMQSSNDVCHIEEKKEMGSPTVPEAEDLPHGSITSPSISLLGEIICDIADFTHTLAEKIATKTGIPWVPKALRDDKNDKRRLKKLRDPNEPRRPLSSYNLWCEHIRKKMKLEQPDKSLKLIDLADMWKGLPVSQKTAWEQTAKEKKDHYFQQMEAYKATSALGGLTNGLNTSSK